MHKPQTQCVLIFSNWEGGKKTLFFLYSKKPITPLVSPHILFEIDSKETWSNNENKMLRLKKKYKTTLILLFYLKRKKKKSD